MKKKIHAVFRNIFLILNILVLLLYVLSFNAGSFDPRKCLTIAFLGMGFPLLFLCILIFCVLWFSRKKWVYLGVNVLLLICSYAVIRAHFGFRFSSYHAGTKPPKSIRVLSYNVHFFHLFSKNKKDNSVAQVIQMLETNQPDILAMQEFYTKVNSPFELKKIILEKGHFNYSYFEPTMTDGKESIGLIIFSKFPIHKAGSILFDKNGKSGNRSIFADILIHNSVVRVYNVHLQSLKFKTIDYEFVNSNNENTLTEVASAKRVANLIRVGFEKRAYQVSLMKANFASCKSPYLVMGDFNDTPASYTFKEMTTGLNNAFSDKGNGWGQTFYEIFPKVQIDYIAHHPKFKTLSYEIIQSKASDHYPIVADLSIN